MKEIKDDLFKQIKESDAICITTNCSIDNEGCNPMGGGCAGAARRKWPKVDLEYGMLLRKVGHVPVAIGYTLKDDDTAFLSSLLLECQQDAFCAIVAYPTMHSIFEPASLDLVVRSAELLVEMADINGWNKIVIPRMGSGIGGLKWPNVKMAVQDILDDRFTIVSFEHEE